MKPTVVGMTYDLRKDYLAAGFSIEEAAEFDSEETIAAIEGVLRELGFDVVRIGNVKALCGRLAAGERWDLVFNIAEGVNGRSREAQVPALLEAYGIAYTFSDSLVLAATLDKAVAKRLAAQAGIKIAAFHVVEETCDIKEVNLNFPLFAKPVAEGTAKGVGQQSIIRTGAELEKVCRHLLAEFRQPVLVEEYLPGREFTVGLLGTGKCTRVLGTMEIEVLPAAGGSIYSFEAKEYCEKLVRYSKLQESGLRQAVEDLALRAYLALGCRDAGRVDVRLDSVSEPVFMEVNGLPGLHPTHSDLPMIATQEGMPYRDLISAIVQSALSRYS